MGCMIPYTGIVDPWSAGFVDELVREFRGDHEALLKCREERKSDYRGLRAYIDMPSPQSMKNHVWTVVPPPTELITRRVEITGPAVDPKMAINALNSGADGYMVDGEDSMSPTWENVLRTQSTLTGISRKSLRVKVGGVEKKMAKKTAVLHYRPRGLHMFEYHWIVDGKPAPASIVDAGLFMWWNARELVSRGSAPYLYLPKFESEFDARFWDRLLCKMEKKLGLREFSTRVTVLIETLPGLIRAENIVWALKDRITGLNVGRWDYMLSLIRSMHDNSEYVLPDRSKIGMGAAALNEYARYVVGVAHRRGCHAIGGMAADVPNRKDVEGTARAMAAVRVDKEREVEMGHDGTWVAHPDLVPLAMEIFSKTTEGRFKKRWNVSESNSLDLFAVTGVIDGDVTFEGVRSAVRTSLVYLDSWLRGNGCVAIEGKMEDAATAEISRGLLWQWVHRDVKLADGRCIDSNFIDCMVRGEAAALAAAGNEPLQEAMGLLMQSIMSFRPVDYILTPAYDILVRKILKE